MRGLLITSLNRSRHCQAVDLPPRDLLALSLPARYRPGDEEQGQAIPRLAESVFLRSTFHAREDAICTIRLVVSLGD